MTRIYGSGLSARRFKKRGSRLLMGVFCGDNGLNPGNFVVQDRDIVPQFRDTEHVQSWRHQECPGFFR